MFILGDLITIPATETKLPLPWWHRAPLAFESRTHVTLSLTAPKLNERPGDLLVSVIDPYKWEQSFRIKCLEQEKPGTVAKLFGLVAQYGWNIALSETVTVEASRTHVLDLICEPKGQPVSISSLLKALRNAGFKPLEWNRLGPPDPPIKWNRPGVVREGWLVNNHGRGLFWRDELNKQIAALGRPDEFDLTKLVFSADTEKRCLRIVVPRKGVQNVRIEHRDECGALKELTDALYHAEFNVLSSLLKRGGAAMDNAVLVAICEPVSMGVPDAVLREKISKEVANIDPKYRAELKITEGHSCYSVLDARRQGDLVIRVPELLRPRVDAIREKLDPSRIAIFLSYRFYNARAKLYMDEVKKVLAETGCQVVESPIRGRAVDLHSAFEDVSAAMWASDAVIVLVAAPEDDRSAISLNLAHEFGFFQGNGKPILWLVEKNPVVDADFNKFTNLQGLAKPSFSHESFDDNNHQDSIPSQIKKWLQEINAIRSLSHSHNSVIS